MLSILKEGRLVGDWWLATEKAFLVQQSL